MRKKRKLPRRWHVLLIVWGVTAALGLVCFAVRAHLANILSSQKEAERWAGDSGIPFSQVTCFLPADGKIDLAQVSRFRTAAADIMKGASLDMQGDVRLMLDAWSTSGKVTVSSDRGRADVNAIAVGGSFFEFQIGRASCRERV